MIDQSSFLTDWFKFECHWTNDIYCVIDQFNDAITFDGLTWKEIPCDHL